MFTLDPKPTFRSTVQVPVAGEASSAPLVLLFRHKGKRDLRAWIEGATGQRDAEFLGAVVANWEGVQDENGQAVPFTPEAFDKLLDTYAAAGDAIFNAYLRELTEARSKN